VIGPDTAFDLLTGLPCSKAHVCDAVSGRVRGCQPIPAAPLERRIITSSIAHMPSGAEIVAAMDADLAEIVRRAVEFPGRGDVWFRMLRARPNPSSSWHLAMPSTVRSQGRG